MRYFILFASIAITALSSCDPASGEVIVLNNQSDSSIYATMYDTGFVFRPHTSTIFNEGAYAGTLEKSTIDGVIKQSLLHFKVYTDEAHTSEISINYKDPNEWTHETKKVRNKSRYGDNIYTLTIENNDL